MKKLLLLLPFMYAFQCTPEPLTDTECNCVQKNFYDNGYEMVIMPDTPANESDCNGNTTNPIVNIKGTDYWYAFEIECN